MKLEAVLGGAIGLAAVGLALWPGGSSGTNAAPADELSVAAAASLGDVLEHLAREFEHRHGVRVRLDCASSGLLRTKVKAGVRQMCSWPVEAKQRGVWC